MLLQKSDPAGYNIMIKTGLMTGFYFREERIMRLDKYLKVSRIIKRRTVANEACDAGRVSVNGKPARASYEVKPGDIIEIALGNHPVRAEVVRINEYAKKDDAPLMYKLIQE